jgi:multidrug transporter EmrE-like cation transporter
MLEADLKLIGQGMVILFSTISALLSIIFNVFAQILLKKSVNGIALDYSMPGFFLFLFKLGGVVSFWLGILLLCLALGAWLIALKNLPLSIVYPFTTFSIIFVALASSQYLGETINSFGILGYILIISGVLVLFASFSSKL